MNQTVNQYSQISDDEFDKFRSFIYEKAGISLSSAKKSLVLTRLSKRLRILNIASFSHYYQFIHDNNSDELQQVVDLLTTNETYFFREKKHFDFLESVLVQMKDVRASFPFRVWSAASSSGEEAYSIAMTLASKLGVNSRWQVLGTDISSRVIAKARSGLYSLDEKNQIPQDYLRDYCLKGVRSQEGKILIDEGLKENVRFEYMNLNGGDWIDVGNFDIVFLRNVMIYFDHDTKVKLVRKVAKNIKKNGYLFVGHSETLNGVSNEFELLRPSIYKKR